MIGDHLPPVMDREPTERPVDGVSATEVAGDERRVAPAGVRPRERGRAQLRVAMEQVPAHRLHREGLVEVAVMPEVEVVAVGPAPPQEDVAHFLQEMLSGHHPSAFVLVARPVARGTERGRERLAQLEEDHVLDLRIRGEKEERAPIPDTADTGDLAGDVGELVPSEDPSQIIGNRPQVIVEEPVDGLAADPGQRGGQPRGVQPESVASGGAPREPANVLTVGMSPTPQRHMSQQFSAARSEDTGLVALVEVIEPDVEVRPAGLAAHPSPIGGGAVSGQGLAHVRSQAVLEAEQEEARGEPLEVPFPRTPHRLVEIIDVEHLPPFGRADHPEVPQVGVTAQLHVLVDHRGAGQIGGHDRAGAAEEIEEGARHALVPQRKEPTEPGPFGPGQESTELPIAPHERPRAVGRARYPFP